MGYQHAVPRKFKELREYSLDIRRIHDHLIRDAGQVGDLKGNRAFRIHKSTEPVCDLPARHLDRPDLDDLITDRAEARSLNIKYDVCIVQRLIPRIDCDLCQIIHHIAFHSVNDLKRIVLV